MAIERPSMSNWASILPINLTYQSYLLSNFTVCQFIFMLNNIVAGELVHALNCSNYPDASGKLRLMHMLHKLSRSHLWQIFPRRFYPWMFSFSDTNPWMFPSSDTNASFVQSLLSVILSCLFSLVFTVMALSGQSLSVDIYLCPKYTNVYLI